MIPLEDSVCLELLQPHRIILIDKLLWVHLSGKIHVTGTVVCFMLIQHLDVCDVWLVSHILTIIMITRVSVICPILTLLLQLSVVDPLIRYHGMVSAVTVPLQRYPMGCAPTLRRHLLFRLLAEKEECDAEVASFLRVVFLDLGCKLSWSGLFEGCQSGGNREPCLHSCDTP